MNSKQAKKIPISRLLEKIGLQPVTHTESGYWFHSPFALNGDHKPSFQVSKDDNLFHDWSSGAYGTIIDLAMALLQTNSVSQALDFIDGLIEPTSTLIAPPPRVASEKHTQKPRIEIVESTPIHSPALLDYITKRHIPVAVAMQYCTEIKYRMAGQKREMPFYAIGFPNDSGGYELRNAYAKLASRPKDITTTGDIASGQARVFEGYFDFLSAIVLDIFNPKNAFAVVLNSTSLLKRAIKRLDAASNITCYLDNDDTGRWVTDSILASFPSKAKDASAFYKHRKDLNDFLTMNDNLIK